MSVFQGPEAAVLDCLYTYEVRNTPLVVGVSGGVDSVCLLHVLARHAHELDLTLHVVHVHHGIRGPDADEDARFVRKQAHRLGVPVTVRHVNIPRLAERPGISVEEAARQWRYAILGQEANRMGAPWIAVAHNADDQVETVLMHLLRGAGLAGLRGMRPLTWYGYLRLPLVPPAERPSSEKLWLLRPLLHSQRSAIEAWTSEHDLPYRFDRSNLDTTYFRNRLRHEVLPLLERINPQVRTAFFTTAELAAADFDLLRPLVRAAWAQLRLSSGAGWIRFSLPGWRAQPLALRRGLLRDAVMDLRRELRDIGFQHIEQARAFLENPRMPPGSEYTLPAGLLLRREYTTFWLGEAGASKVWDFPQLDQPMDIPAAGSYPLGNWTLELRVVPRQVVDGTWRENPDPWTAYFDANSIQWPLVMRPRRVGDRIEPLGMPNKHVLVSEIMVNAKIPRHARDEWPILTDAAGTLLWIVGIRQSHNSRVDEQTHRVAILHLERIS